MTDGGAPVRPADLIPARALDLAVRIAGALVSLAGGLVVAVLAVLAVPWRVDTGFGVVRIPLAVGFALAGTLALLWFAPRATGTRWGVLLPALGWFAVMLAAMRTTGEGSHLLMPNDLVAALTLFSGTTVMVVGVVLTLTGHRTRPPAPSGPSSEQGDVPSGRRDRPSART